MNFFVEDNETWGKVQNFQNPELYELKFYNWQDAYKNE